MSTPSLASATPCPSMKVTVDAIRAALAQR